MADTHDREQQRKLLVRGLLWCFCLGMWTVGLLTTYPIEVGHDIVPSNLSFPAAKILHVSAYAFLTAFLAWLPLRRERWLLLVVLSLHAAGTEFGQRFVPGRTGVWTDVVIDHAGLLLGLALTWKHWLPRRLTVRTRMPLTQSHQQNVATRL